MYRSKVMGTGIYTPKKVVTNDDLAKTIETNDEWIVERTGIKQRHICSTEGGEFPSDMGVAAAKTAIANAGLEVDDIDMILFGSCAPDYQLPNSATIMQTKLGMTNKCACLDIAAACSGFVYGFNIANALIQTGQMKNILIVGSEMLSPEIDWSDRSICILFGDGCGTAVLGRADDNDKSEIFSSVLTADGTGKEFFIKEYGGAVNPITHEVLDTSERFMKMNGKEMFKVAVRTLAQNAMTVIEQAGLTLDDVDWIVPHQANIRILEATAKTLGADIDKFIINIHKYGNTSAATVPLAFHEAIEEGKIKRGDIVLFDAFGAGLTAGATLFRY